MGIRPWLGCRQIGVVLRYVVLLICKVARQLKEAERVLRNFRLGYAAHYAEERRQHKFLYDVYTNFIRGLHSKHDKLHKKVKARFAQMDDLLEKFKGLPSGVKLVLSSLD